MTETDTCMKKKCEPFTKKTQELVVEFGNMIEKNLETKIKSCKTDPKKDPICEPEKMKKYTRNIKKMVKKMRSSTQKKKAEKITMKTCKNLYCNKGCKGTFFEAGSQLPESLLKKIKTNKILANKNLVKIIQEERKKIFGKKTDVLTEDSFYEELKPSLIKKLKKEGAISGCIRGIGLE